MLNFSDKHPLRHHQQTSASRVLLFKTNLITDGFTKRLPQLGREITGDTLRSQSPWLKHDDLLIREFWRLQQKKWKVGRFACAWWRGQDNPALLL